MMEQAESIEDIIAINEQLTDVRYQIESMESQLRTYDNQVDYSTVNLYIDEVERYTPGAAKSAGARIAEGFSANIYRVGSFFKNFAIEFIILLADPDCDCNRTRNCDSDCTDNYQDK